MPIPATTTATAIETYQRDGCCSTRTLAKFIGWFQIIFNMFLTYITYANVVAVSCLFGRIQGTITALFVLLNINGLMFLFGIFFGIIFSRGASSGDMNDLERYRAFALFSIRIHLIALFVFMILEVRLFVVVSVTCLLMHVAGLQSVAGVDSEIKMIGKLLILEELVRNKQEELAGTPPPYSTVVV